MHKTLYHGTSTFHLRGIIEKGMLLPNPPRVNWLVSKFGVYFTDSLEVAGFWANTAAKNATEIFDYGPDKRVHDPVIIEVSTEYLDLVRLVPDYVDLEMQQDYGCIFYRYLEEVPYGVCVVRFSSPSRVTS